MSKTLEQLYKDHKTRAVLPLCNLGGIEILDVVLDADGVYIISCFNDSGERKEYKKTIVREFKDGTLYFKRFYKNYRLDDFMRVDSMRV